MNVLDWTVPSSSAGISYGRFTKAVAKHIKAQVAMWQENWEEAIKQCEDILNVLTMKCLMTEQPYSPMPI